MGAGGGFYMLIGWSDRCEIWMDLANHGGFDIQQMGSKAMQQEKSPGPVDHHVQLPQN